MDNAHAEAMQKAEMAPSHLYLQNNSQEDSLLMQGSNLGPSFSRPFLKTEGPSAFSNILPYSVYPMGSSIMGPPWPLSSQTTAEYNFSMKDSTATATTGEDSSYQLENPSMSLPQAGAMASRHEDVSAKRAIRLFKNREAARECRRKKKEYVRCLENRVAVLEKQNKKLIEELRALKDIYRNSGV